jgi:DNA polymerase-3 subunit epsilon
VTLQESLNLQRPLTIFDCETTGPNPSTDRIVELGFVQLRPGKELLEWSSLINPGIPIPKAATFGEGNYPGHGITDDMVTSCRICRLPREGTDRHIHLGPENECHEFAPWPRFTDIAENLLRGFTGTDFGGYNVKRFDLPLMVAEFSRAGHVWGYDGAKVLDGFRLWQIGEKRTLSDASERFLKRKHDGSHRVLADVHTSLNVITEQLGLFRTLPRDLAKLHDLQWPVDVNAIDPDGRIVWKNGIAVMNFGVKWRGKPLTAMTQRDLKWIANDATGVSAHVKAICRDCLAGKFPTPPAAKEPAE